MVKTARQPDINYSRTSDPDAFGARLVVYFHEAEGAPKCRPRVRRAKFHEIVLSDIDPNSADAWDALKKSVKVDLILSVGDVVEPENIDTEDSSWEVSTYIREAFDDLPDITCARFGHEKAH